MSFRPTIRGLIVTAAGVSLAASLIAAQPAGAAVDRALNGRFQVVSNGDWATTNQVYRDEATVRSIWTIEMTCTNATTCSGRVTSDAGWSSDIDITNIEYVVRRDIPGWETCADGSGRTVTGHQMFRFFPVAPDGSVAFGSRVFAGFDVTQGESGACSLNQQLEIAMPMRLEALD